MKVTREQLIEMIKNNNDVSNIDTSDIIDMSYLFLNNKTFNQDISKWNTSNVKKMVSMFENSIFNRDISRWDVSNVTNMESMFRGSSLFNQDISLWNVSNVINFNNMFLGSTLFNQDISLWNISNALYMSKMFLNAKSFNQNLSNWNFSNVKSMIGIFYNVHPNINNKLYESFIHLVIPSYIELNYFFDYSNMNNRQINFIKKNILSRNFYDKNYLFLKNNLN